MKSIFKTAPVVVALALASFFAGCAVVEKVKDRIPYIEAKAPEILLDIHNKDWVELAKDVAEALGYDKGEMAARAAIRHEQIVQKAPQISEAIETENWLLLALLLSDAFALGR